MAITNVIEQVTPNKATAWLETMVEGVLNRPVRQTRVTYLKGEIEAGHWAVNGATIVFDEHGCLMDGQHRLWAIIEAGMSVRSHVVRGVARKAFTTIDTGANRSAADTLHVIHVPKASAVASALKWVYIQAHGATADDALGFRSQKVSNQDILELWRAHPEIIHSVSKVTTNRAKRVLQGGVSAFCHWRFAQVDAEAADEFMERVADGALMEIDDPRLRLRDRLVDHKSGAVRLTQVEILALTIKAWNAWRDGRSLKVLAWRRAGPTAESFPWVKGLTESMEAKSNG